MTDIIISMTHDGETLEIARFQTEGATEEQIELYKQWLAQEIARIDWSPEFREIHSAAVHEEIMRQVRGDE